MQQICLPVEFYTVFYSEVPYGTAKEFSVKFAGKSSNGWSTKRGTNIKNGS